MDSAVVIAALKECFAEMHPVVEFDPSQDKLCVLDFTEANASLTPDRVADTERLAAYVNETVAAAGARYGIGGYGEHRTIYARSQHFGAGDEEPRRLHLGVDVWGPAGTKIMSPMDGIVHSFAFNNNDSDYGATLIVTYNLGEVFVHVLYGHLSLNSLKNSEEGKRVRKGEVIGEMGMRFENGNWPPHLHCQLIIDMGVWKGDYPGVCKYSEREEWLKNCPDAGLVLRMNQYIR